MAVVQPRPNLVGSTIKKRRFSLGLTQNEVAQQVGLSGDFLGMVESGRRGIGLQHMPKLADVLGIKPKDLVLSWLREESPAALEVLMPPETSPEMTEEAAGTASEIAFLYGRLAPPDQELVLTLARRLVGGLT